MQTTKLHTCSSCQASLHLRPRISHTSSDWPDSYINRLLELIPLLQDCSSILWVDKVVFCRINLRPDQADNRLITWDKPALAARPVALLPE